MDLNEGSLTAAKARIEQENPGVAKVDTVVGDVLAGLPEELKGRKFDSVSLFNLLHCLPPGAKRKTRVFELAAEVLSDEGVLVGCTILGREAMGWNLLSWITMFLFNLVGAFGNWGDDRETLEKGLKREFEEVKTWVVGQMLVFRASKPRLRTG